MKVFTVTVLAFAVVGATLARGDSSAAISKLQGKRGVPDASAGYYAQTASQPTSLAYTKVQQPVLAQRTLLYQSAQPTQVKYASVPALQQQQQQYQYESQALAYAPQQQKQQQQQQVVTKYAAAPVVAKIPYSLANDVSSFTYSSPLVSYNSLGFLKQIVGNGPAPSSASSAGQTKLAYAAQAAPAAQLSYRPVQTQKVTYAAAPVQQQQQQYVQAAAPAQQQYIQAVPQQQAYPSLPQTYSVSPQAYPSGAQTYSAAEGSGDSGSAANVQQSQAYAQALAAASQAYASQTAQQQPSYSQQAAQYYQPQVKYASSGVSYAPQ